MNTRLQIAIAFALIGTSACVVSHKADACGLNLTKSASGQWKVAPPAQMSASAFKKMMVLTAASLPKAVASPNLLRLREPITGLYEVVMTAEGNGPTGLPDGAPVDHAYSAWHADGNEIMNSGRPAGDSNFCMGTWARTGVRTYTLNHFMLSWAQTVDADGVDIDNTFVGPANIQETVTLSKDGNSYTGTFVLTQYDPDYNIILPGGIPIKGTVTGTRKTVDSSVTY